MAPVIDYKSWTVQAFMDECYRLGVKAQCFVFLLSKVKEKRLMELNITYVASESETQIADQADEDMTEGMEGLAEGLHLGPLAEYSSSEPSLDLDPAQYPEIPNFLNYSITALLGAYQDRDLRVSKEECSVSRSLLVKSLIQDEFSKIEKRFHRQMYRKPTSPEDVELRKRIVLKHFELERKCLNVLAACDKEIFEEKLQMWDALTGEMEGKQEEWLQRVEDVQGAGRVDGYTGLGFIERWFT